MKKLKIIFITVAVGVTFLFIGLFANYCYKGSTLNNVRIVSTMPMAKPFESVNLIYGMNIIDFKKLNKAVFGKIDGVNRIYVKSMNGIEVPESYKLFVDTKEGVVQNVNYHFVKLDSSSDEKMFCGQKLQQLGLVDYETFLKDKTEVSVMCSRPYIGLLVNKRKSWLQYNLYTRSFLHTVADIIPGISWSSLRKL